jgi:predicted metal-dependent phosphoesterase TrpH
VTGLIDLHVHTTASDGSASPAETVRAAAERGVTLLAICDHDTTVGIAEAQSAAKEAGITLVPGVELSGDSESNDIHVLGYFIDIESDELQAALLELRESRNARNTRILAKLAELGAPVSEERVREIAGYGSVGRPHIAAALVEAGHVATGMEAFYRYLARGKPAFSPRKQLEPGHARDVIHAAGGLAALAHPIKVGSNAAVESALDAGLDAIEVYHSDHTAHQVETLLALARSRNLLVVGGTDSHGPHSDRPLAIGSVTIPEWVGDEVLRHAPGWWREGR